MKVIYCANNSIGSWLIRLFTWSRFSHTVYVEDDTHVIDSTLQHGGVRRRLLADIYSQYPTIAEVTIDLPDEQAALEFARAQIGKPYDQTAILGFVFHRNWAEDDSWFCSELIEAVAVAGKRLRFRDGLYRISPELSYTVI